MPGVARLAGAQFAGLPGEKARNLEVCEALLREARRRGAEVVLTPECVLTGFTGGPSERAAAESIPGPSTERLARVARAERLYVFAGLSELRDGEVYNALAAIGPDGSLLGVMRKVHINRFETKFGWRNGSEFPTWRVTTGSGEFTLGAMICYDREVPEAMRLLMLQQVDVVLNPLGCTCTTMDIHRCLLRTRAFENETPILVVNHAAPRFNGHSLAIDAVGDIVGECGEEEVLLPFDVDVTALAALRANGIYGRHHRRPELYAPLCSPAGQLHPPDANLPPAPGR